MKKDSIIVLIVLLAVTAVFVFKKKPDVPVVPPVDNTPTVDGYLHNHIGIEVLESGVVYTPKSRI